MTPNDVRSSLIEALQLDLVGPRTGHPPHGRYVEEVLPIAPSKWYLTGFLIPHTASPEQPSDDDVDDTLDETSRAVESDESDDDAAPEPASARKAFFPSSMGLSVLVSADTTRLQVKVAWADYAPASIEARDVLGEHRKVAAEPVHRREHPRWYGAPLSALVQVPGGSARDGRTCLRECG